MSTRRSDSAAPAEDFADAYAAKSDTIDLPMMRGTWPVLFVHSAGNVQITSAAGTTLTVALPVGLYPLRVKRLWSTGTTASAVTALY